MREFLPGISRIPRNISRKIGKTINTGNIAASRQNIIIVKKGNELI
jgi:hypothetical protein